LEIQESSPPDRTSTSGFDSMHGLLIRKIILFSDENSGHLFRCLHQNFSITQANVDDREPLKYECFLKDIFGKLFGDKDYISKELTPNTLC
jgi:hypothetical protein